MTSAPTQSAPSSVEFMSRGVGQGWAPCFVCAASPTARPGGGCHAELAAFVPTRAAGQAALDLFTALGCVATLDYRPAEPNWVQVKLGACDDHLPSLWLLHERLTRTPALDAALIERCLPRRR